MGPPSSHRVGNAALFAESNDDSGMVAGDEASPLAPIAKNQAKKRTHFEDESSSDTEVDVSDWAAENNTHSDGVNSASAVSVSSSSTPVKGAKVTPHAGSKATGSGAKKAPAKRAKTAAATPAISHKSRRLPSFTGGPSLMVTGSGAADDGFM